MTHIELIAEAIDEVNQTLSGFSEMDCIAAWRSVGTNIFFEFGMPIIKRIKPKTREPFTVVRGEASIAIHADDWRLRSGAEVILTSDAVDHANLSQVAREFLLGVPMPRFGIDREGVLELLFARSISVRIESNAYPDDADDYYDEVSINLPQLGFRFNYRKGFYVVSDE